MGLLNQRFVIVVACLLLLGLVGCEDPHAEDKAAIRAVLETLDQANMNCDGAAAVAVMSSGALDQYSQIVKLALDGTEQEVRSLGPQDLEQLIQLRNRMTRSELEGMDGRGFQEYATSECWYTGIDVDGVWMESAWAESIGSIQVFDSYAYADIVDEQGKKTGYQGLFEREDGVWKINEFSFHPAYDQDYLAAAEFEGVSVEEWIIWWEEDAWGEPVGEEIWQPMR